MVIFLFNFVRMIPMTFHGYFCSQNPGRKARAAKARARHGPGPGRQKSPARPSRIHTSKNSKFTILKCDLKYVILENMETKPSHITDI